MPNSRTPYEDRDSLQVETPEPSRTRRHTGVPSPPAPVADEAWDVFELDEDTAEPEPEYGDFWGELDDDELT